jgi:MFS family permease
MAGPVVGQFIYSATDYKFGVTFYIFSGIIFPFMLLALFLLPNSLNRRSEHGGNNIINNSEDLGTEKVEDF